MRQLIRFTLALTLSIPGIAQADMFLNKSIVEFSADASPREDVVVFNKGDDNLYVSLEILQVNAPGTEEEKRVKVVNPESGGLIVTPNKLVIPAQGRKTVRIVNLQPATEERIYRINVTPIVPPLEPEDSPGARVQIVVAYQILVMVRPVDARESIVATRSGEKLQLTNDGNTNVLLSEGEQCDIEGANCQQLPAVRLYAGNSWSVETPYDTPVSFTLTGKDGIRQVSY